MNPTRSSATPLHETFGDVREWIFDLDNTLYPPESDLFSQVDRRMTAYIANFLSVDPDEAYRVQKALYRQHGTTLRGLIDEHAVDPHDFLADVHDIDYTPVAANPALGEALLALPGRRFIFTNGDVAHAQRVMTRLGIGDHFDEIFDIVAADFVPKPQDAPYDAFIAAHDIHPERAAMFEDMPRNLSVPKRLGMRTVLVVPGAGPDTVLSFRQQWEDEGRDGSHIDHVTNDLASFLRDVVAAV